VADLDPELPLYNVDTVDNLISRSLVDRRTPALLAAGFAVVALMLATLGVYGVPAYQVSQRTREFGIRLALGANAQHVFRHAMGEGALMLGAGTLMGLAGATLRLAVQSDAPSAMPYHHSKPCRCYLLIAISGSVREARRAGR
jgi:ABC-type antimicrobial peptide transport system permease subunit